MYHANDIVIATLTNAPRSERGARCFGFAEPLEGGPAIYITQEAMRASGLTAKDLGARVRLLMKESGNPALPPFAVQVERDDSEIDGETPDPIEYAILNRLSGIERVLAQMLLRMDRDDRSQIEEV